MAVATLILNDSILNISAKRQKLSAAVARSVRECRKEVQNIIIKSTPQGRVYKRGSRSHRASRRGQPPAVDSGNLVNTIQGKKTSEFAGKVAPTAAYADKLENKMDRKFVEPAANKYEPKFLKNVTKALK